MTLTIVPLSQALIPSVIELLQMQQKRLHTLDSRLPALQTEQVMASSLSEHVGCSLVVLSEEGRVRGTTLIWQGRESNPLSICFPHRNGMIWQLILPGPQEQDANLVAALLLTHLVERQRAEDTALFICRPASDIWWAHPIRFSRSFQLAHVCAFTRVLGEEKQECPPWLLIRRASRADTEEIIDRVGEEIEYQGMFSPFVYAHEIRPEAYRERIASLWEEEREELLVAEHDGIRGMIHLSVSEVNSEKITSAKTVGRIKWLSVQDETEGQQIAQLLLQAAVRWFGQWQLDGYLCWFHPTDSLLTSLLELAGFRPLWTVYGHRAH